MGCAHVEGQYFTNHTPVTGEAICEIPRSNAADIELLLLDAAHAAKDSWGKVIYQSERSKRST